MRSDLQQNLIDIYVCSKILYINIITKAVYNLNVFILWVFNTNKYPFYGVIYKLLRI